MTERTAHVTVECEHGWETYHCTRDAEGSCPFRYDQRNPDADCRCFGRVHAPLVSVPWCSVHRCSASVHEGQCWFHWGASNHYMNDGSDHGEEGARPLLPCVLDGVVWKVVTE